MSYHISSFSFATSSARNERVPSPRPEPRVAVTSTTPHAEPSYRRYEVRQPIEVKPGVMDDGTISANHPMVGRYLTRCAQILVAEEAAALQKAVQHGEDLRWFELSNDNTWWRVDNGGIARLEDVSCVVEMTLSPPISEEAVFVLAAMSCTHATHPAHWAFWGRNQRRKIAELVHRVVRKEPPSITPPREIAWIDLEWSFNNIRRSQEWALPKTVRPGLEPKSRLRPRPRKVAFGTKRRSARKAAPAPSVAESAAPPESDSMEYEEPAKNENGKRPAKGSSSGTPPRKRPKVVAATDLDAAYAMLALSQWQPKKVDNSASAETGEAAEKVGLRRSTRARKPTEKTVAPTRATGTRKVAVDVPPAPEAEKENIVVVVEPQAETKSNDIPKKARTRKTTSNTKMKKTANAIEHAEVVSAIECEDQMEVDAQPQPERKSAAKKSSRRRPGKKTTSKRVSSEVQPPVAESTTLCIRLPAIKSLGASPDPDGSNEPSPADTVVGTRSSSEATTRVGSPHEEIDSKLKAELVESNVPTRKVPVRSSVRIREKKKAGAVAA